MVIRKTAEQIKDEILSSLNNGPLSIEQIRVKIDSNWSTTNNYLNELSKSGKIKEIISADKAKIYQRIFGDTYFEIPITNEERKRFRTLFSLIAQEYKSRNKQLTKTEFAKCAVHVIKNDSSGLSELPTVWYLYGCIPQMIADPSQEYFEEIKLEQKNKIKQLIMEFIVEHQNDSTSKIQRDQHEKYGEELYVISDKLFKSLNRKQWDDKMILSWLNRLFINCPVDSEFPEIFELTEKLISIIDKINLMGIKLEEHKKEVLVSLDSLWKFIAVYKLYKSRSIGKNAINKERLLKFYLGSTIESRKTTLKENILELNSIYLSHLSKFDSNKIKLSDEVMEIRKIMADWTGEEDEG